MQHSRPTISVCIPAYNSDRYIAGTIESVLNQTYPDFELVIVDDGSTDRTESLLESFTDPRIRRYRNDVNLGFAENWNRAASLARGEFVKLLCHDDVIYPECLERQAAVLADPAHGSVQLVTSARDVIGPDGRRIMTRSCPLGVGTIRGHDAIRGSARRGTNVIGEPSVTLFRRKVLEQTGPFSGANRFMIDLEMWTRMLRHGDLFALPERLSAFRIAAGSMSWEDRGKQARQFKRFLDDLRASTPDAISAADRALGGAMAELNALARQILYDVYLRGSAKT